MFNLDKIKNICSSFLKYIYQERILLTLFAILFGVFAKPIIYMESLKNCQELNSNNYFFIQYSSIKTDLECLDKQHHNEIIKVLAEDDEAVVKMIAIEYLKITNEFFNDATRSVVNNYPHLFHNEKETE